MQPVRPSFDFEQTGTSRDRGIDEPADVDPANDGVETKSRDREAAYVRFQLNVTQAVPQPFSITTVLDTPANSLSKRAVGTRQGQPDLRPLSEFALAEEAVKPIMLLEEELDLENLPAGSKRQYETQQALEFATKP